MPPPPLDLPGKHLRPPDRPNSYICPSCKRSFQEIKVRQIKGGQTHHCPKCNAELNLCIHCNTYYLHSALKSGKGNTNKKYCPNPQCNHEVTN